MHKPGEADVYEGMRDVYLDDRDKSEESSNIWSKEGMNLDLEYDIDGIDEEAIMKDYHDGLERVK